MNGSVHSSSSAVDIKLKRGPAGLGFNIVGGVDQQYVVNDSGIYVSKIKEDGAAGLDGRLQEGDKILAINGVVLEDRTHKDAVELFRRAGEYVELRVLKKSSHHMNGPTGSQPDHDSSSPSSSSSSSTLGILAVLAGAAAIFAFIYMRHLKKHF
ncbi:Synaptojanin-2-binding protein Mitochondrial outer membrane protein 25 [Larimichthys crocea]|uniref:Synaptojanin-2-binding protein n=1 Tax=Larimichthys crocea TaxID=215358 RepID=A0A6G0IFF4_LARCR|nr:Synaptojanin-2-binding protein Mitochondrial outer membrane protein 25 [Larimichthys crocea]